MTTTQQITVKCKLCHRSVTIEYTPNPFISGEFIKNSCICSRCSDKTKPVESKAVRQPYKD